MNKIIIRLVAAGLSLALAVTVVMMSTYAWFTLSTNPAVSGIQMTIGDNTIRVAADMTATVDGVTYHYPGAFSDTLNFGQHESYQHLQTLGGLMPVSTADGISWFLPGDDNTANHEVLLSNGQLGEFQLDATLAHANLASSETDAIAEGNYVYLDFWVVSPVSDYTLRVSTGEDSGGSFLIDLPQAVEEAGVYTLEDPSGVASAVARVGFLVNAEPIIDNNAMLSYEDSEYYNSSYTVLRGNYQEPGSSVNTEHNYSFSIYEPNGTYHPGNAELDDAYVTTHPIGWGESNAAEEVSAREITAVQKYSSWSTSSSGRKIDQIFQTFLSNPANNSENLDDAAVTNAFYSSLQGQIWPYVTKGQFIDFSSFADGVPEYISADTLNGMQPDEYIGASEDVVVVELERNIPQRIRMFIWLEGQDVDCTENAAVSSFALNIELAGGSN